MRGLRKVAPGIGSGGLLPRAASVQRRVSGCPDRFRGSERGQRSSGAVFYLRTRVLGLRDLTSKSVVVLIDSHLSIMESVAQFLL